MNCTLPLLLLLLLCYDIIATYVNNLYGHIVIRYKQLQQKRLEEINKKIVLRKKQYKIY